MTLTQMASTMLMTFPRGDPYHWHSLQSQELPAARSCLKRIDLPGKPLCAQHTPAPQDTGSSIPSMNQTHPHALALLEMENNDQNRVWNHHQHQPKHCGMQLQGGDSPLCSALMRSHPVMVCMPSLDVPTSEGCGTVGASPRG